MLQAHPRQSPVKSHELCYRCGKPGHWARFCPESPNRSPTPRPVTSDEQFPATHCHCGAGHCDILVSNSINNPNRKYYRCPGKNGMHCNFFKWCDELKGDIQLVLPNPYPICGCRAGVCRLVVETHGLHAGRSYYACHIKKGEGACNFKQWVDESPEYLSISSSNPVADQSLALDDFELSPEVEMQLDAIKTSPRMTPKDGDRVRVVGEAYGLLMKTPEAHPHLALNNVSESPNSKMTIESIILDDFELSPEVEKQLDAIETPPRITPKNEDRVCVEGEACGLPMKTPEVHPHLVVNNVSESLTIESIILDDFELSPEVEMQLDASETSPRMTPKNGDRVCVEGEDEVMLGEASGLPMKTPEVHPQLVVNSVSESPNSKMIIQSGDTLNNQMHTPRVDNMQACRTNFVAALNMGVLEGAQPRVGLLPNSASPPKDSLQESNIMTSTTVAAFEELARKLQNDLISLLESMSHHNHEKMTDEANTAFSALSCLRVDFSLLHTRVDEFIKHASSLAHIEEIKNATNTCPEDLVIHRDSEQHRLEELKKSQQEAQDAFMASNNQYSLFLANATGFDSCLESETKKKHEAEIAARKEAFFKISKSVAECKKSLRVASEKAEEALEAAKSWEIEWNKAKAAYEAARVQLRS